MPISVMIKPSSSKCNLNCKYCFYTSLAENRQVQDKGFMSVDTAKKVIKSALDFGKDTVYFVFQGGEPMLIGIDFFKEFVKLANELNTESAQIFFSLQTNGTLINDEWCQFFKENHFLLGVSLDGDEELNDYRVYKNGKNSFNDIMNGIELLKKYNVSFNILSVLTKRLADNFRKSYRFFKSNDLHFLQYIPCLKPFDEEDNEFAIDNEHYKNYLNSAFKLYFNQRMRNVNVSIRQFDNYLLLASNQNAEQCGMNGPCSAQFVVEGNGDTYPCDFYCTDEWKLGNINENSFDEMYNSQKSVEFLKESFKLHDECKTCPHFQLCRGGGCKRNKDSFEYCPAYKAFFENSTDMIMTLSNIR